MAETSRKQRGALNVTKSSQVIEDKGTGGYYLLVVLMICILLNNILNAIQDSSANFPIAAGITLVVFLIYKLYINGKPKYFVIHLLHYAIMPKRYTHFQKNHYRAPIELGDDAQ